MRTRYTTDQKLDVVRRAIAGETHASISKLTGISEASIYNWVNKARKARSTDKPKVIVRKAKMPSITDRTEGVTVTLTHDQARSLFDQLASKAFRA